MASFEARALNRSTGGSGGRTIGQLRLPYHLVEPTVIAADLLSLSVLACLPASGTIGFF